MIYYIGVEDELRNTAGTKAPNDIKEICADKGYSYRSLIVPSSVTNPLLQKAARFKNAESFWKSLKKDAVSGDVVIYQHPVFGWRNAQSYIPKMQEKGVKFIALIHDLESLRKGIEGVVDANKGFLDTDQTLLSLFDAVICHNTKMKQYLISQGFDEKKLICLEIFDYLTDYVPSARVKSDTPSICIAGNLAKGKCSYIYNILSDSHNPDLKINLYGVNYEEGDAQENLIYHGSFKPEELSAHLEGDFGLVWDGNAAETCAGNTGEYLRYNNPHKTSLYLASGIPVLIWKQSAMADFINANGVGITVDSLYDAEVAIKTVTAEEYTEMQKNVMAISEKLRNGYYFSTAIEKALAVIGK
ncbi:MAG TPA: hypothetical protein P5092_12115 [Ruminococcus sp.]|nr:hypothetical protein [Ruminococcus sp.]